jgi:hypothetical protein
MWSISGTATFDDIRYSPEVDANNLTTSTTVVEYVFDLLATPIEMGKLIASEELNGGSATYKTTGAPDLAGSPGPWDALVEIAADGQMMHYAQQWLKIQITITAAGSGYTGPVLDKIVANFSTTNVAVTVANFLGKTCWDMIQRYAQVTGYETGFDEDGVMYFRPKAVGAASILSMDQHTWLSKCLEWRAGVDRIVNVGVCTYNGFVNIYDAVDAGETSPTSEEIYGRLSPNGTPFNDGGEDFSDVMIANDINLGAARARVVYDERYLPKKRGVFSGKFCPWLQLSDVLSVTFLDDPKYRENYAGDPLQFPGTAGPNPQVLALDLPMKIIGITKRPDEAMADYTFEEVLA